MPSSSFVLTFTIILLLLLLRFLCILFMCSRLRLHLSCVGQCSLCQSVTSQKSCQLCQTFLFLHASDIGNGIFIRTALFNHKMYIRHSCDLRKMGNTDYLMTVCDLFQFLSYDAGSNSTDAGVDFIKDEVGIWS